MTVRVATKLQSELAEPILREDSGPIRALRLGVRTFLSQERIDMSAMARQLDINRATLYRWVGSREQFMVEMIWYLSIETLERLAREVESTGGERVIEISIGFAEIVIESPGMQHWLASEGEAAMNLLTRYEAGYQPRLVNWVARLLESERAAGNLELKVEPSELAYVFERILAAYIYLDLITGEKADARRADPILRLLLP